MVGLVETMLKLHKDLPKAKTLHEQESKDTRTRYGPAPDH